MCLLLLVASDIQIETFVIRKRSIVNFLFIFRQIVCIVVDLKPLLYIASNVFINGLNLKGFHVIITHHTMVSRESKIVSTHVGYLVICSILICSTTVGGEVFLYVNLLDFLLWFDVTH